MSGQWKYKRVGSDLLVCSADPVAEGILVVGGRRDAGIPALNSRVEAVEQEDPNEGAQQVRS